MKKTVFSLFIVISLFFVQTALAQQQATKAESQQETATAMVQEMQKTDPQAAQAFSNAVQKGDFETAKKVYEEFKKSNKDIAGQDMTGMDPRLSDEINQLMKKGEYSKAQALLRKFQKAKKMKKGLITPEDLSGMDLPSFFESTLSGDFPRDILMMELKQFGYDLFERPSAQFSASAAIPVGPDYLIGSGDQFTLTLWGTTEGIFNLVVTKEGEVTLPKVGVVSVAGTRFGELEHVLRRHLSRYYSNFNLSIAMGKLKSITVYLVGEVTNPGSYPLNSLTSVYGALTAAGGPTKKGTLRSIQVLRGGKVIRTLDLYDFLLKGDRSQDMKLQHEDTIFVPIIGPIVGVAGSVYRPAIYEFKGTETIGSALQTAGGIMPIGMFSRLQINRFADNQKRVYLDIRLESASTGTVRTNSPDSHLKEPIQNMDVISVLPIYDTVWETVNLQGDVRQPGDYQWRPDLKVGELIRQGQLLPTADKKSAEVIRLTGDFMDRKIMPINLDALQKGDESQNILLMPKDQVRVYTTYRQVEKITITGEVIRPGEYETYKGESLSDILRRVGGFTREAYPYGAVFKRRNVKESEAKNARTMITRLQSQVLQTAAKGAATASSSEETTFARAELGVNQELLNNLKSMQENLEGRVALNITDNIDEWAGSKDDLILQDGDTLLVPKRPQEILVLGEVYSQGAQIHQSSMIVKDYIERSGGFTKYAEQEEIFVIQANGYAFGKDSPRVGNVEKINLKAGDVVIVPQKVERYAGMRLTKDIIDILFKTAVVIATITVLF